MQDQYAQDSPHRDKDDQEHEVFLYIYKMSANPDPNKNTTDDVQENQEYSNYNLNHASSPPLRAIWEIPVS